MLYGAYLFSIFVFGLLVGSFLNVYLLRLGTGRNSGGFSSCASCGKRLKVFELVPLLSYFFLQGRCSKCKIRISLQYPLLELSNALFYALLAHFYPPLFLPLLFYLSSITLLVVFYDFKHLVIPDKLLFRLAFASIFLFFAQSYAHGDILNIQNYLSAGFSALVFSGALFAIYFFSKGKAMGFGDVKMALPLFILVEPFSSLNALFLAFFFGALFSVPLLVASKISAKYGWSMKSELAFGPFIILAFWLVYLFDFSLYNVADFLLFS